MSTESDERDCARSIDLSGTANGSAGGVRVARVDDAATVIDTLLAAFVGDPFVEWIVGARGEIARRRYFELTATRLTLPHGASFIAEDAATEGASVALFAPSDTWRLSPWAQLTILPRVARVTGMARFSEVSHGVELVERGRPREPFLLLTLLGTHPLARRRGLGSRVLAEGLARCDREDRLCVLDTSNEANVGFYERRGFRVTQRVRLPSGPMAWSMVREPKRERT